MRLWFKKNIPAETKEELLRESMKRKLAKYTNDDEGESIFNPFTNAKVIVENIHVNEELRDVWDEISSTRDHAMRRKP